MNNISFEDLNDLMVRYIHKIHVEYDMDEHDTIMLIDMFKTYAGEYHRLVTEGKIPPDQQFKHDPKQAIDFYNSQTEEEL